MRFLLGDWAVDPSSHSLRRDDGVERQVEPRAMQVLEALSERPGEVLSAEQLLARCWPEAPAGDNPVHKTVAQLRRALEDSATAPRYIETIRKRGYRVVAPVRSLEGEQARSREGGWRGGSPFRGLQPFDATHAEVFFGRDAALDQLLQTVRRQWQQRRAFTLLLGPSGSGKTSLVLAGLFPALQGLSAARLDLGDIGSLAPLDALAAALLDWELDGARPVFPGASAAALARSLAETPAAALAEIRAARAGRAAPLLLFVDRLEALFVAPQIDAAGRAILLDVLQQLADGGDVIVVAACRNDFYPRLAEHPLLMRDKALGAHFDLAPPTRAEIAQMIRLPARAAGLSFGVDAASRTRLDDQLCDDAAQSPDALPLLQYTLEELYRRRRPHGELSFAAYRELGGLEGAVGQRAEATIAALLPIQQAALPQVLALLVLLPGEGQGTTGRRALWRELGSAAERELVQALVDARLLVSDLADDRQAGFRVAHEAILRRWPRVTEWIAAHQQALQLRSRLHQQVQRWLAEGRAREYLLPRGKQLEEAVELLGRTEFALSADERAFVEASQQRATRGERLRIAAISALAVLTLLSAALAWRAERAESLARRRGAEAEDLLSYMLGEFADRLRPIGRLELLDSVGGKALAHLAGDEGTLGAPARLQRAKALTVIGEVRVSKRELDAALAPLQQARELLRGDPPAGLPLGDWRKAQGTAAFWIGHIHYNKRQFGPARRAMQDYADYSADWLRHEPGHYEALLESSYAQNSLGSLMLDSGDLGGAVQQFSGSAALKRQLLALRPQDLSLKSDLADSLSWQGRALAWQGDFEPARQLLGEGLGLIVAVRKAAPQDLAWVYREALLHAGLAEVLDRQGRGDAAQAELGEAARRMDQLLRVEPDNRRWRLLQLNVALAQEGARGSPRPEQVARLLAQLDALERGASAGLRAQLLELRARAAPLSSAESPDEALGRLRQLIERLQQARGAQPEDLRLRTSLANTRLALQARLLQRHQPEPARQQCMALLDELSELRSLLRVHYELTRAWVEAYSCLGRGGEVAAERDWLARKGGVLR